MDGFSHIAHSSWSSKVGPTRGDDMHFLVMKLKDSNHMSSYGKKIENELGAGTY